MKANRTWENFKSFVDSQNIEDAIKVRETENTFFYDHQFYLSLFEWFSPVFPSLPKSLIQQLSFAGYLYFRTILLLDQLMDQEDDQAAASVHKLMLCLTYHEQAIKQLTDAFGTDSVFWEEFDTIKKGYIQANLLEKKLSLTKDVFTKAKVRKISAGKSNLCIATVLALCTASDDYEQRSALDQSLLELHTGFQLFDDIDDYKKDIENNQWTYAAYRVDQFMDAHIPNCDKTNINTQYKYLFISGIAQELITDAKEHFQKSLALVHDLPLHKYKKYIEGQVQKCEKLHWEIEQTLLKTKAKANKSNVPIKLSTEALSSNETLPRALNSGLDYLRSTVNDSYQWHDFLTNAGLGTSWITAYVGYQLAEVNLAEELVRNVGEHILKNKDKASAGYNASMIRDGDSLNFTIGFLHSLYPDESLTLQDNWLEFQEKDGGWVTYNNPSSLRTRLDLQPENSVNGWTHAHPCVSAVAACVLKELSISQSYYDHTMKYLMAQQANDGSIPSYWWTSSVYATAYTILAMDEHDRTSPSFLHAIEWLKSQQHDDGYWAKKKADSKGNAFYTALAVKALLKDYTAESTEKSIDSGIEWLLKHQLNDGSWPTDRILRIPAPNVTEPSVVNRWRRSSFGVNTVIDDHFGNFTTSTAVNALEQYRVLHFE